MVGLIVFQGTSLSSEFERKKWFWEVCSWFQDTKQNVPNVRLPSQTCLFSDILANVLRPSAYLLMPIFALKPWDQVGHFEYH